MDLEKVEVKSAGPSCTVDAQSNGGGDVKPVSWASSSLEGRARGKVRNTYVNIVVCVTEELVTTRFSGTLCRFSALP